MNERHGLLARFRDGHRPDSECRGFTLLEALISMAVLIVVITVLTEGVRLMSCQLKRATGGLGQIQQATLLLERIRTELSSAVMNPLIGSHDHQGNSFLISEPNGTSIQFVTERQEGSIRQRYLISYEARSREGNPRGPALALRRKEWRFLRSGPWTERFTLSSGWPTAWIGPLVDNKESQYQSLALEDLRWLFLVPDSDEARVFFRVKLVVRSDEEGRLLPLSTLISVPTPDRPEVASRCPCLMAPCFHPEIPDCDCCFESGGRP